MHMIIKWKNQRNTHQNDNFQAAKVKNRFMAAILGKHTSGLFLALVTCVKVTHMPITKHKTPHICNSNVDVKKAASTLRKNVRRKKLLKFSTDRKDHHYALIEIQACCKFPLN